MHIPSLSANAQQRGTLHNLYKQQNRAITRLCEVNDPNAPFQMSEDLVERLLGVGGVSNPKGALATENGND